MARKKRDAPVEAEPLESDDETVSVDEEAEEEETIDPDVDRYHAALEDLSAKRGSVKTNAAHFIASLLSRKYCIEVIDNTIETLASQVKKNLSKSSCPEHFKIVQRLALTLGPESTKIHDDLVPVLMTHTKKKDPEAVRALGFLLFAADAEEDSTMEIIEELTSLVSDSLTSTLLLLTTCLPAEYRDQAIETWFELVERLLDHDDLSCRIVGGRMASYLKHLENEGVSPVEGRLDEIEDMISVLANDATTGKSRKVKAEQRGVFKEFQATFEEDIEPSEKLKIGKAQLLISKWPKVIQLSSFRTALTGLDQHLKHNEFLGEVFNIHGDWGVSSPHLTKDELRVAKAARQRSIGNDRRNATLSKFF